MTSIPATKTRSPHRQPNSIPVDIPEHWRQMARRKGYELHSRIRDRYHVALTCQRCFGLHVTRIFTLMSAQPCCPHCLDSARAKTAEAAGLLYDGREPGRCHYGRYIASCGHLLVRQYELIDRAARDLTGVRCETCLAARYASMAAEQGWMLLGPAGKKRPNYRAFQHVACGHEQEIALANMATGRFGCGRCDPGWCAAPSSIYLIRIALPDGRRWIKCGYSRDPNSRMRYQLGIAEGVVCNLAHEVALPSGHAAIRIEKKLHASLRRDHPHAVIPRAHIEPWLNVVSEIYDARLEPEILRRLGDLVSAPST